MDINRFMRKMVRKLGLRRLNVNKQNELLELIEETLLEDTIPVFSQFFPHTYITELDLNDMRPIVHPRGGYVYKLHIPELVKADIPIITVNSVEGESSFSDWNTPSQSFNVEDLMLTAAASNISSLANRSFRDMDFEPPNELRLIGYGGYGKVSIELKIQYPTFGDIPISLSEVFEDLAMLDLKISLYEELKQYIELQTAEGNIDLKLDGWDNAKAERDELISRFRNEGISDTVGRRIYTRN